MYTLIIIWENGEKQVFQYDTYEKAEEIKNGFLTAFGLQIEYTCII